MARASEGWVNTAQNDYTQEFWSSNVPRRINYGKKVRFNILFIFLKEAREFFSGATITTFEYTL